MCQYIFSCSGFRENCTLHIGFQSIILYACHRQIGFYYHFSKHPCIRYELHDTHIGRSSRFIHCLISDRGYFTIWFTDVASSLNKPSSPLMVPLTNAESGRDSSTTLAYGNGWLLSSTSFPFTVCADTLIGSNMLTTSMTKYIFIFSLIYPIGTL